jgi:hypothetical protein
MSLLLYGTFSPLGAGEFQLWHLVFVVLVVVGKKVFDWIQAADSKQRQGREAARNRGPIDVPESFGPPLEPTPPRMPTVPRGPMDAPSPLDELLQQAREEARRRQAERSRQRSPGSSGPSAKPRPQMEPPPPPPRPTSRPPSRQIPPTRTTAGRGTPGGSRSRFPTESIRTEQPPPIRAPEGITPQPAQSTATTVRRMVNDQPVTVSAPATHITSAAAPPVGNSPASLIAQALHRPGFLRNQILLAEILGQPVALRQPGADGPRSY